MSLLSALMVAFTGGLTIASLLELNFSNSVIAADGITDTIVHLSNGDAHVLLGVSGVGDFNDLL